jgi:hypothetical protein
VKTPARSPHGSAMIMALLLIALVGSITAAGIAVLMARSGMVEQTAAAAKRRIALENSKALAQQFVLQDVIPSTSGATYAHTLADPTWGGITVLPWSGAPMLATQRVGRANHFNPGNGDGYVMNIPIAVSDGSNPGDATKWLVRTYHVMSRSPLLAGTLFASQTPDTAVSIGPFDVDGGAFFWRPTQSMTLTPNSYSIPDSASTVTFTNSSDTAHSLLASNLALPRQIANPRSGGEEFYDGQFDVMKNSSSAANSFWTKTPVTFHDVNPLLIDNDATDDGVTCDGAGAVTVTLENPRLGSIRISGNATTLTLQGQTIYSETNATSDRPTVLIVIDQTSVSPGLTAIRLNLNNSRRLVVAVKKVSGSVNVDFTTAPAAWRLILEAEQTPVTFSASGIAEMKGGIRSDRSVLLGSGGVRLILETDPLALDRYTSRNAWVESYEQ